MSGHSKWSTIKRKKGINDQKRGQLFTKLTRMIMVAVVEGGGVDDPEYNVKLRLAVERAKAENMPKYNIARAIDKAKGDEALVKEVVYEGFGPGGISLIIVAATDNSNRTHAAVKNTLEKRGGKIGSSGSVLYLFDKCGVVIFNKTETTEETVFRFADETDAFNVEEEEGRYIVYIPFGKGGRIEDIFYRPKVTVSVDSVVREHLESIIEALEDLDDVSQVYANYE